MLNEEMRKYINVITESDQHLEEGMKENFSAVMMALGLLLGSYDFYSVERNLEAGKPVVVTAVRPVISNHPLQRDKYVLKVDPNIVEPIVIDMTNKTITLQSSDISNPRLKHRIAAELRKVDPALVLQGSKDITFNTGLIHRLLGIGSYK